MEFKTLINGTLSSMKRLGNEVQYTYSQMNVPKPKLEKINDEIQKLQKERLKLVVKKIFNSAIDDNELRVHADSYKIGLIDLKLNELTKEYNAFAAKQEAAQRAFEALNK